MENEAIPVAEYEQFARRFSPRPDAARDWARLAKRAGQKYMVMTTKHHEGFCLFDTQTTNYCAPRQGPGRDLVKEYVDAARAEGLRVGFYYSLMDWHHPDGARAILKIEQDRLRLKITGLPSAPPDHPLSTIEIECDGEPKQDQYVVRNGRARVSV